jgi:hypothetical protein
MRNPVKSRHGLVATQARRLIENVKKWREVGRIKAKCGDVVGKVLNTGQLNSVELVEDLHRLDVDFLLLGGCDIIKPAVIRTASRGVINGHPALLPWMRNVGVVGRSLLEGVPLGATTHFVEEGIDTGRLIERRLVRPSSEFQCLADCELAAYELAAEMMADVVLDFLLNFKEPVGIRQIEKFSPSRWLSEDERRLLDKKIVEGLVEAIFESSEPFMEDRKKLKVPNDFSPPQISPRWVAIS